ncbi:MAG TPA: gamma-glutamyl-gamma-aminobutyrate hydrolase family protein [Longimicrobiales bacterium]|nr:gamma-glutamyl-gamma-aminobutyrate hydrolase family protein [Longimicrobiales bacterium]
MSDAPDRPLVVMPTTSLLESGIDRGPVTYLDSRYTRWIEREGMTSVLVSPAHDDDSVRRLVGLAHGLALAGGEDLHPSAFGEEADPRLGVVNGPRDRLERMALDIASEADLPVLALCRGMQVLNVARGGTLWQDLPSGRPGSVEHRQSGAWHATSHAVRVAADSRLAGITGSQSFEVNSFHHQGIRELGVGLRAVAWAPDGLVEAVEGESGWVLGVQWHPERHPDDAAAEHPDRLLFTAFAEAVKERASSRPRAA